MASLESEEVTLVSEGFPKNRSRSAPIGKGAFGVVYIVIDNDNPEERKYVEKEISISQAKLDKQQNIVELNIFLKLNHPRIVKFFGFTRKNLTLSLYLEYMPLGTLQNFMNERKQALNEDEIKKFTKQLLQGVIYLHEHNPPIIHRDIKGGNILLKDVENIVLTDFGISKIIHADTNANTPHAGTYLWMAPEVVSEKPYDIKADIWSVGCTVVEMFTSEPPSKDFSFVQIIQALASKQRPIYELPGNTSADAKRFLDCTFQIIPSTRPSASQLINHSFIN